MTSDLVMISNPLYRNIIEIIWQYGLQQLNFYIICSEDAIFSLWWSVRNVDETLRKKKKIVTALHTETEVGNSFWINKYWNRLWLIKIMHFNAMNIINQLHSVSKILKNETIYKISTVYICLCICMCVCV